MDQKHLYSIDWTDFITDKPCNLKIWGNVDKTDIQVYYTCLINSQQLVITNFDGLWIDNSGRDNELAVKLGHLLESCNFLLKINK